MSEYTATSKKFTVNNNLRNFEGFNLFPLQNIPEFEIFDYLSLTFLC